MAFPTGLKMTATGLAATGKRMETTCRRERIRKFLHELCETSTEPVRPHYVEAESIETHHGVCTEQTLRQKDLEAYELCVKAIRCYHAASVAPAGDTETIRDRSFRRFLLEAFGAREITIAKQPHGGGASTCLSAKSPVN